MTRKEIATMLRNAVISSGTGLGGTPVFDEFDYEVERSRRWTQLDTAKFETALAALEADDGDQVGYEGKLP